MVARWRTNTALLQMLQLDVLVKPGISSVG